MRKLVPLFCLMCMLSVSGCAVMSKSDCVDASWYREGHGVALKGETDPAQAYQKRAKRCQQFGVIADRQQFDVGYEQGLLEYCVLSNAVKLGSKASSKSLQLCPEEENPGFASAYDAGYKLYVLRSEERKAKFELDNLARQESQARRQLADISAGVTQGSTEQQRRNANRYVSRLRRDISDILYQADHWRKRHYEAQRAADAYQELLEVEYGDI